MNDQIVESAFGEEASPVAVGVRSRPVYAMRQLSHADHRDRDIAISISPRAARE
jgi:hypothetical protein